MEIRSYDGISEAMRSFYALDALVIKPETRGLINTTLHVFSGETRYVATLFNFKTPVQVREIAEIMLSLEGLPIAKPIHGRDGYVHDIAGKSIIVCPFIEGYHAVGEDHTRKTPIGDVTHRNVSKTFWELQKQLTNLTVFGSSLPKAADGPIEPILEKINYWTTRLELPDQERVKIVDFCMHCKEGVKEGAEESGVALVHSDFERQNVLINNKGEISGIVDFDALKRGQLINEFSQTFFNFVCCDPMPNPRHADIYLEGFARESTLPQDWLGRMYSLISRFCIEDISGFLEVASWRPVNIPRLVDHYNTALFFAHNYFKP